MCVNILTAPELPTKRIGPVSTGPSEELLREGTKREQKPAEPDSISKSADNPRLEAQEFGWVGVVGRSNVGNWEWKCAAEGCYWRSNLSVLSPSRFRHAVYRARCVPNPKTPYPEQKNDRFTRKWGRITTLVLGTRASLGILSKAEQGATKRKARRGRSQGGPSPWLLERRILLDCRDRRSGPGYGAFDGLVDLDIVRAKGLTCRALQFDSGSGIGA